VLTLSTRHHYCQLRLSQTNSDGARGPFGAGRSYPVTEMLPLGIRPQRSSQGERLLHPWSPRHRSFRTNHLLAFV